MKQHDRWCNWKLVERNGKKTKIPIDSKTGQSARSNDSSTWSSFEDAVEGLEYYTGIGYFFAEPYMGIDIDDVSKDLERFERNDLSDNIIFEMYESLKSYAEVSPSGNGIHIILKGTVPGGRKRKDNVEMYDHGRFFTMTGKSLGKYKEINEPDPKSVQRIYNKYLESDKVVRIESIDRGVEHDLSEMEIVGRISQSKQDSMFRAFMNDGWQAHYSSQSEADMAFANMLAFWCARDFAKMDSLFRQSSLMRDKWDEKRGKTTYGEGTLYKAINETQNVYKPSFQQEKPKYEINFDTGEILEPKTYPNRSWDDTGNADRFMDRFGDLIRYSYIDKKFIV